MKTAGWLLVCACALIACGKSDTKHDGKSGDKSASGDKADKSGDDKEAAKRGAVDPWAAPPPGSSNKVGGSTGGGLAAVDTSSAKPTNTLAAKVDIGSIAQPDAHAVEIKGFGEIAASGFTVTYNASNNATHEQFRNVLATNHVFEQVAEGLNKTVRIPTPVAIQLVDCNTVNAFYDPNTKRIIVCYELLDYFVEVFKPSATSTTELGNAVIGATMFSFFHEAGHGLIHLLDLPAVGREEDSVDQLATLTLIAGGDDGVGMALAGAYWFQLQSKSERKTPFWDEHGFDGQRFYNIVCLIYGSNPDKYAGFVSSGTLPPERARRCPEEYAKINKAWEKLLQPHLSNGAATNVAYKPPVAPSEAPHATSQDPWGTPQTGTAPSAPSPAPAPPPEPQAPAAPTHAITCEQVAAKAIEFVGMEAKQRVRGMTAEQIEEVKRQLETQLPAMANQILAECAKEDWSDASRKCVLDAPNLATASNCH